MFIIGNFNSEVTIRKITAMNFSESDKKTTREEREQDQAIEEYIEPNPNDKTEGIKSEPEPDQDGMGISKKAKRQSSDEGDTAKRK